MKSNLSFSFAKYVANGNDFILFDNRQDIFPTHELWIQKLCQRSTGIGADGVLLLENSKRADFRMRIFNSDGSEAEMCGNGLRCLIHWLSSSSIQKQVYAIEVMDRIFKARCEDELICIEMEAPTELEWHIPLAFNSTLLIAHHLNTGVPHTLIFSDEFDLLEIASFLRHHVKWQPKGTNVTLATQIGPQHFNTRTFERGVEAETQACGTGAVAVALAAAYLLNSPSPITILPLSNQELIVEFSLQDAVFQMSL